MAVMGRLILLVILFVSTDGLKYKALLLDDNNDVAPEVDESGSGEVDFGPGLVSTEADPSDIVFDGNDIKDDTHETQVEKKSSIPLILILAPASAAVVVLAVVVIFIILLRKRNQKKSELERPEGQITTISNNYCDVTYRVQGEKKHVPNGFDSLKKE